MSAELSLRCGLTPAFYFGERVRSVQKSSLESRLLEICEAVVAPHGFRIVDIDCALARRSLIRVFIDVSAPAEGEAPRGNVTLDDCVRVSDLLSPALDVEDVVPGPYELEVSSPGLERRLRLESDFSTHLDEEVKLRLTAPVTGLGKNVRGRLLGVTDSGLRMEVEKKQVFLEWSQIRRGNLVWNFDTQ